MMDSGSVERWGGEAWSVLFLRPGAMICFFPFSHCIKAPCSKKYTISSVGLLTCHLFMLKLPTFYTSNLKSIHAWLTVHTSDIEATANRSLSNACLSDPPFQITISMVSLNPPPTSR
jgi:hypothetical protein